MSRLISFFYSYSSYNHHHLVSNCVKKETLPNTCEMFLISGSKWREDFFRYFESENQTESGLKPRLVLKHPANYSVTFSFNFAPKWSLAGSLNLNKLYVSAFASWSPNWPASNWKWLQDLMWTFRLEFCTFWTQKWIDTLFFSFSSDWFRYNSQWDPNRLHFYCF